MAKTKSTSRAAAKANTTASDKGSKGKAAPAPTPAKDNRYLRAFKVLADDPAVTADTIAKRASMSTSMAGALHRCVEGGGAGDGRAESQEPRDLGTLAAPTAAESDAGRSAGRAVSARGRGGSRSRSGVGG